MEKAQLMGLMQLLNGRLTEVANGIDLLNGRVLYEQLSTQSSIVKLMHVTEKEIEEMDSLFPDGMQTIQGTMQIHQVIFHHIQFRVFFMGKWCVKQYVYLWLVSVI